MTNAISEWFLAIFPWAPLAVAPVHLNNIGKQNLESKRSLFKTAENLSAEEEIIIQMAKEYPTLFLT